MLHFKNQLIGTSILMMCCFSSASLGSFFCYDGILFRYLSIDGNLIAINNSMLKARSLPIKAPIANYLRTKDAEYVYSRFSNKLYWADSVSKDSLWKSSDYGNAYDGAVIDDFVYLYWLTSNSTKVNLKQIKDGMQIREWTTYGSPIFKHDTITFLTQDGNIATIKSGTASPRIYSFGLKLTQNTWLIDREDDILIVASDKNIIRYNLKTKNRQTLHNIDPRPGTLHNGTFYFGIPGENALTHIARWNGKSLEKYDIRKRSLKSIRFISDRFYLCFTATRMSSSLQSEIGIINTKRNFSVLKSSVTAGTVAGPNSTIIWNKYLWVDLLNQGPQQFRQVLFKYILN